MSIKKYGKENFIKEILEECKDEEHLNESIFEIFSNLSTLTTNINSYFATGLKVGNYGLLFDDGNVHLHSTSPGTNLWLNCSGSGMFVVNGQSGATNGMCVGTSIQSGFVTIVGSKSVSIAQPYGYLISSGAGSTTGTSPNPYSLTCDSRIMSSEFNAPSDERLKMK